MPTHVYTFAERIKKITDTLTTPDGLSEAANQAALLSIIALLFSFLGAGYASIGATEAWLVNIFGSIFTTTFGLTWFG